MAVVKHRLTEEEFLCLPDDGRKYELVDGEAKVVPTNFEHDMIGAIIISYLMQHAKGHGAVTTGQTGFRMASGNIRCPDVSFTLKERLPDGKVPRTMGDAAPDFCVEIISPTEFKAPPQEALSSPSEDLADIQKKLSEYFASGARLVWHVFPETQSVVVYRSSYEKTVFTTDSTLDTGDILPGFQCPVADLFAVD